MSSPTEAEGAASASAGEVVTPRSKSGPPSLSEEDFQRMQNTLLELKNKNYQLEEQCRKQKSGKFRAIAKRLNVDRNYT